jgi:hypothetical protein
LAYSAFGDAEGRSNGLLAAVSFDELLDVHARESTGLNFFCLGC